MITFRPSIVRPFVSASVNIFKRLLLWSRWANFAQISYRASLGRGNERLLKWSRSVDLDGRHVHIWLKALIFFSPKPKMPWDWIFAQVIKDEISTNIDKIIVVHWRLTFLRRGQVCFLMQLYGHHIFVWENKKFKRLLFWSLWANVAQTSCRASLVWGNERLLKWSRSIDQDGRHAHIWLKPLKIFSRTEDALGLNLCANHRGREVYQKCLRHLLRSQCHDFKVISQKCSSYDPLPKFLKTFC